MNKLLLVIVPLLAQTPLSAEEAFVKDGNVYYKDAQAKETRMTSTGKDSGPRISPDGKSIAFIRDTPGVTISAGSGDVNATELWLIHVTTQKTELLAKGKTGSDVKNLLAGMSGPCFSPDGRSLYFNSEAWATSGSVQKISLDTKKVKFIIDGGLCDVIRKGKNAGSLLVDRALIKYDKKGESLGRDIYLWLVGPDGKPIREIGQSESKAAETFRNANLK